MTKTVERKCLACGKQGQVVMENSMDRRERGVFCVSCAKLLASEMVKNQHGDHVCPWVAA